MPGNKQFFVIYSAELFVMGDHNGRRAVRHLRETRKCHSERISPYNRIYVTNIYRSSVIQRPSHRLCPINQLFPRETFILLHSVTKFPRHIVRKYILCSFLPREIDSVNGREKVRVCFYCDNGRLGVYREVEKLVKRFENRSIRDVIWHYQLYFSIPFRRFNNLRKI